MDMGVRFIPLIILLLGILLTPSASAAAVEIRDLAPANFSGQADVWRDDKGEATPETLTSGQFDHRFQPWHAESLKNLNSTDWLRLQIRNPKAQVAALVVNTNSNGILVAELIYRNAEGVHVSRSGRKIPYADWPLHYQFPALPFEIPGRSQLTIYLRIEKGFSSAEKTPTVSTMRDMLEHAGASSRLAHFTLGIVLGVTIYVLLIARFTREWAGVGYYLALMASASLMLGLNSGLLLDLPFDITYLQSGVVPGFAIVTRMLLLLFVRTVCDLKQNHPRLNRVCLLLVAAGAAWLAFYLLGSSPLKILGVVFYLLICHVFLIPVAVAVLLHDRQGGRLFFVCMSVFLVLSISGLLAVLGWIPSNALTAYSRDLSTAVFALFFALILIQRIEKYRSANQELTTKTAVAYAESRAKSELLAVMSHEIRTPMNGVLGMIELLQGTRLDETQRLYVNTVQNSGKTLLTVINDILDFSKADAGKLSLRLEPFDLGELIEAVVAPLRSSSNRQVQLIASIAPEVPLQLRGDPIRLQQILNNLLSNAFKFTERGSIELRVECEEQADGKFQLRCRIADTGIGIRPQDRERLFQPFSQLDNSMQRRAGGTGLGLIICQQLVTLMEGGIKVTSAPGAGSTFEFWVLMERSNEAPLALGDVDLNGLKLLGIDDRQDFLHILHEQATALGMQVQTVTDSHAAVTTALTFMPDVIAIDLDMPGMDGFAVDRALSAEPQLQNIPRLLLTASCNPPGAPALADSGFAGAFSKPTSTRRLGQLLAHALSGTHARGQSGADDSTATSVNADYSALRVLVAEDNSVNRQVVEAMLRRFGVLPDIAVNGIEAVSRVTTANECFDLILMDCEMPGMDGYRATQMIRQFERATQRPHTHIVALSAHALPEHRQASLSAGMDEHVNKPVNLAVLSELLKNTLGAHTQKRVAPEE